MLERVLDIGERRLLVNELGSLQFGKHSIQSRVRVRGNLPYQAQR